MVSDPRFFFAFKKILLYVLFAGEFSCALCSSSGEGRKQRKQRKTKG